MRTVTTVYYTFITYLDGKRAGGNKQCEAGPFESRPEAERFAVALASNPDIQSVKIVSREE